MRKLMTMLLGISLLSASAMFAGAKKSGGGGGEKNTAPAKAAKAAEAAKAAKSQRTKAQSVAEQKAR